MVPELPLAARRGRLPRVHAGIHSGGKVGAGSPTGHPCRRQRGNGNHRCASGSGPGVVHRLSPRYRVEQISHATSARMMEAQLPAQDRQRAAGATSRLHGARRPPTLRCRTGRKLHQTATTQSSGPPRRGGGDPEVLRTVELVLGVLGGGEQWPPPFVIGVAGAGQGVATVELVPGGAVLVTSGVALGLAAGEFPILGLAVGVDELFEEGAGGGPYLVAAACGFAADAAAAPGQRLGGVTDARLSRPPRLHRTRRGGVRVSPV